MGQASGGTVPLKKYLPWAITAFVIFYLLKSPGGSAAIVHNAAHSLFQAGDSLSQFVDALI